MLLDVGGWQVLYMAPTVLVWLPPGQPSLGFLVQMLPYEVTGRNGEHTYCEALSGAAVTLPLHTHPRLLPG